MSSYLYAISSHERPDRFKFGIAKDPHGRRKKHLTGSLVHLALIWIWELPSGVDPRTIETEYRHQVIREGGRQLRRGPGREVMTIPVESAWCTLKHAAWHTLGTEGWSGPDFHDWVAAAAGFTGPWPGEDEWDGYWSDDAERIISDSTPMKCLASVLGECPDGREACARWLDDNGMLLSEPPERVFHPAGHRGQVAE